MLANNTQRVFRSRWKPSFKSRQEGPKVQKPGEAAKNTRRRKNREAIGSTKHYQEKKSS